MQGRAEAVTNVTEQEPVLSPRFSVPSFRHEQPLVEVAAAVQDRLRPERLFTYQGWREPEHSGTAASALPAAHFSRAAAGD